ncbi:PrmA3 [Desulfamplus magnetovallimortis]|uniref:PrmA3 n=1 Tax=Desulfamplus magnetovallimortis TaxID=1246637 RepID=A0A1W1HIM2_9BACT|nr:PrmA3 [Desulfamplus magnetovallimortis]
MSNPYENLWIYYLVGIPEKLTDISRNEFFIGNWEEEGFSFLFFSVPCDEMIEKLVSEDPGIKLIDRYEMSGEQWHGDKIESYTTGTFCVSPPWKIPFVNRSDLNHILLDPGVVFGTGRHQTTEDCLGYIEYLFNEKNEQIDSVLDIGTGTGLLAIGAAVLGCRKVMALDFNLLAVKTARHNIIINSLEEKILAFQGKGEDFISLPADLVIANIHYDVMKNLVESPDFLNHKWFILSGLLNSEAIKIEQRLREKGIYVIESIAPDQVWNTILGCSLPLSIDK